MHSLNVTCNYNLSSPDSQVMVFQFYIDRYLQVILGVMNLGAQTTSDSLICPDNSFIQLPGLNLIQGGNKLRIFIICLPNKYWQRRNA